MLGKRWKDWNTSETRPRRSFARRSSFRRDRSWPNSSTWPLVGRSRPAATAISEDLPEPEGPVTATRSRGATEKSTSRRI